MRTTLLALTLLTACVDSDADQPDGGPLADAAPACREPGMGVLIGDSIVAAMWQSSLPVLAKEGDQVYNLAVSGNTIAMQLGGWTQSAYRGDPALDWVFIQVGINDFRDYTLDGMLEDYEALVADIHEQNPNAHVIVGQLLPGRRWLDTLGPEAYADWLALNARLELAYGARPEASDALNNGLGFMASQYDSGDGLHTNALGQALNASWVLTFVDEALGLPCEAP